MSTPVRRGIQSAQVGFLVNTVLAIIKLVAGIAGNAYALVADAVESSAHVFSSFIVWGGLRIASRQADEDYPFGYGKAESLAAAVVGLMLIGAAAGISVEAVREIRTPHHMPLAAAAVIVVNAVILLRPAVHDLRDRSPGGDLQGKIVGAALATRDIREIEKFKVRKAGLGYYVDIHVQANPQMSLRDAHNLSGRVKASIRSAVPEVNGVLIHMEPYEA